MVDTTNNPIRAMMEEHSKIETDIIKNLFLMNGNGFNNIREASFIHYFLPMFLGEVEATREAIDAWITVAGSPFNGVNIVDNNNNVISVVPPLKDRSILLNEPGEPDNDLNLIINDFDNVAVMSPQAAQIQLANDLHDKFGSNKKESVLEKDWIEFLSKYKTNKTSIQGTTTTKINDDIDDDVEY